MDSLSIILLGLVLVLQEIQIISIQNRVNRLTRISKSMLRGMEIQAFINEGFADSIAQIVKDEK